MIDIRTKTANTVNTRTIIEGPSIDLMALNPIKHAWAMGIIEQMQKNEWTQNEVDLSEDAKQYATGQLTDGNLIAYKKALAFVSNLDGIQFHNLITNIGRYITSPEVKIFISRQAWEEGLHVLTYGQMIESIGFDNQEVYWMFETDGMLAKKNAHIMKGSKLLAGGYSPENFVRAVAGNIALEGIYFFSAFLTFYAIARQGLMRNSAKNIKFIQRDEVTHLKGFTHIWHTLREEFPHLFTDVLIEDCVKIIEGAVNLEIEWGCYIIQNGVLGLSENIVRDFIRHLADLRLKAMGLSPLYGVRNSCSWFDDYASVNGTDENNFETKNTAYQVGALKW
jgi:ribonucleoside-diphosphate reductase beta chain